MQTSSANKQKPMNEQTMQMITQQTMQMITQQKVSTIAAPAVILNTKPIEEADYMFAFFWIKLASTQNMW